MISSHWLSSLVRMDAGRTSRRRAWPWLLLMAVCTPLASAAGWESSLAVASDKVQRGFSESDGRSVWLLDIGHAWDTGWSLAAGAGGPAYPNRGGDAELSLTLSKAWQLDDDWLAHAAGSRYEVLGAPRARAYRYKELQLGLAWRGQFTLGLSASPDTSRFVVGGGLRTGRVWSVDLGLRQRLWDRLVLDVGTGWVDQRGLQSPAYGYGSIGLSWGLGPVQMFVSFIDSQSRAKGAAGSASAGPKWVSTAVWSF
jgi:hypothetical protein